MSRGYFRDALSFGQVRLLRQIGATSKIRAACRYCHTSIFPKPADNMNRSTIEHILGRSRGGWNESENITISCAWCNHGRSKLNECIAALRCAEACGVRRGDFVALRIWKDKAA